MKIAYFAWINTSQESGVLKKISKQIAAWSQRGITVKLFALSPSLYVCDCLENISVEVIQCSRIRSGLIKSGSLFSRLLDWKPDVIYYRYLCYFPSLSTIMKKTPTFLEINSYDVAEYRVSYSKVINFYHTHTREFVLKNAKGMFFLTPETAKNYIKYKKPHEIIGDSIDFNQYPLCDAPSNEFPRLVFMGLGISPWFGVDKVIQMAKNFPKWNFDLIGSSKVEIGEELPENVIAHGRLSRSEYEKIVIKADIGIGTMALHRIYMNETTPLKVREYLAYGIPTIIGYKDPDLPEDLPFILSLPNCENNVQDNLNEIRAFVEKWKGKRLPRASISHLGIDVKENQRLELIRNYRNS